MRRNVRGFGVHYRERSAADIAVSLIALGEQSLNISNFSLTILSLPL